jgi:putative ABC transport system permease protein
MNAMDAGRIAFSELRRNALRSGLTGLGIVVGVTSFIVLVCLGRGATEQVRAQVANLGENVLLVERASSSRRGVSQGGGTAAGLTVADAAAIAKEIYGVAAVSPEVFVYSQLMAGGRNWKTRAYGEAPEYFEIRRWPVIEGRIFSRSELRGAQTVVVLGGTTAREIFGDESALDRVVRIQNVPFRIIGVLISKGPSLRGSDEDDVVFVPYTTAIRRLTRDPMSLHRINVKAEDPRRVARAREEIESLLRERHRTPAGRDDDFEVRSQDEVEALATGTSRTMTVLLGALAGVALVVGGIGIMNIMLVSVSERTREIGVRLAVGARRTAILRQFLVEASILSSTAGILGILIGVASARLMTWAAGWPTHVAADDVATAYLMSGAIGIFFGFYPARKASRLDPIDALRYE